MIKIEIVLNNFCHFYSGIGKMDYLPGKFDNWTDMIDFY